jgi:oligopeptide/dipeptide ABC transporter ATP-binding protein
MLTVRGLTKHFVSTVRPVGGPVVKAVDQVSFAVWPGETLGLVGESGSGKTTLGRLTVRLIDPTAGQIVFDGMDITRWSQRRLRPWRRRMQIVFQDPESSLNPYLTVEDIVLEPLSVHRVGDARLRGKRVKEVLEQVGLSERDRHRYPYQFSGGQRQRVAIARALALKPEFLVLDEPTSALDAVSQIRLLELLRDLRDQLGLTYLFIGHALPTVAYLAQRIAVILAGQLVEWAPTESLFERPQHPYTQALLDCAQRLHTGAVRLMSPGRDGGAVAPAVGCPFYPHCSQAMAQCRDQRPVWRESEPGHWIACHRR